MLEKVSENNRWSNKVVTHKAIEEIITEVTETIIGTVGNNRIGVRRANRRIFADIQKKNKLTKEFY